mmetsp:Transcript_116065/g.374975  ORF Transcript_116065/g.374975 Transcript_116065/m.374975 type:complete len:252 (-) Transcript_116065:38-793(-)
MRPHQPHQLWGVVLRHEGHGGAPVAWAGLPLLRLDAAIGARGRGKAEPLEDSRAPHVALLHLQNLPGHALVLAAVPGLPAPMAVWALHHGAPHEVAKAGLHVVVAAGLRLCDPGEPRGKHACERVSHELELRQRGQLVELLDLLVRVPPPEVVQGLGPLAVALAACMAMPLRVTDRSGPPFPAVLVRHAEQKTPVGARLDEDRRLATFVAVVAPLSHERGRLRPSPERHSAAAEQRKRHEQSRARPDHGPG